MPRPLAPVLLVAAAVGLLAGCGGGEERVSLAIDRAARDGDQVVVTTECADDLEVEVRPDPRGSGLVQVSLWGAPRVGRCAPSVAVDGVPADQAKLVDAATGQVVDVEPGP